MKESVPKTSIEKQRGRQEKMAYEQFLKEREEEVRVFDFRLRVPKPRKWKTPVRLHGKRNCERKWPKSSCHLSLGNDPA